MLGDNDIIYFLFNFFRINIFIYVYIYLLLNYYLQIKFIKFNKTKDVTYESHYNRKPEIKFPRPNPVPTNMRGKRGRINSKKG